MGSTHSSLEFNLKIGKRYQRSGVQTRIEKRVSIDSCFHVFETQLNITTASVQRQTFRIDLHLIS